MANKLHQLYDNIRHIPHNKRATDDMSLLDNFAQLCETFNKDKKKIEKK